MKRLYTLLSILLPLTLCLGQEKDIIGTVTDATNGEPLAGAIVQAVAGSAYTFTRDDGSFSLSAETQQVRVQSMGYRSVVVDTTGCPLHIQMTPEATQLRDVMVKAPDILQRSDTLTYAMNKWAQPQDRNMADVLRRLPGVEIADDGSIKYNGEPINRFYIDGSDFVNDRYGVATNNISPADVSSVEIMENHQPIKALEGLDLSQQAGLNIRLKEEARARWIAILQGGLGGTPLLYDASLFAMRIAKRWQNMETLRLNDTGWNPNSQSQRHLFDGAFDSSPDDYWSDYISIGTTSSPIDKQRTRDNLSMLAQSSNARHLSDGRDIQLNATYQSDRLYYRNASTTRYLDTAIPDFVEQNKMRSQQHQLSGEWSLRQNSHDLYLKDNLCTDASWSQVSSQVWGSQSLRQESDCPSFTLSNDLRLVRRLDRRLLSVSSQLRYAHRPHSLWADSASQALCADDLRSYTEARYGWMLRHWQFYLNSSLDLNLHRLESYLRGLSLPDYPIEADKGFSVLQALASPEARYEHHRWHLTLSLPIGYKHYGVANRLAGSTLSKHHLTLAPSLYLRKQLSAKTDVIARLSYSLLPVTPDAYTETVVMTDFRHLMFQVPSSQDEQRGSALLQLRYRNPISALFAHLSARYALDHRPLMHHQLFIDNRILSTYVARSNEVRNTQLHGSISQGLLSARVTIGVDATLSHSQATMMRQDVEQPYSTVAFAIIPKVSGKLSNWFSADYHLNFSHSQYSVTTESIKCNTLRQDLSITLLPTDRWHLTLSAEHYRTRFFTSQTARITFLDTSLRWLISNSIDLTLSASNLLNCTDYQYSTFGSLSESIYSFQIRPRNIIAKVQIKV